MRVVSLVGLVVAAAVALAVFSGQLSVRGGGSGASGSPSTSIESALACLGTAGVPAQITVEQRGTVVVAWGATPSAAERAPVAGCLSA